MNKFTGPFRYAFDYGSGAVMFWLHLVIINGQILKISWRILVTLASLMLSFMRQYNVLIVKA